MRGDFSVILLPNLSVPKFGLRPSKQHDILNTPYELLQQNIPLPLLRIQRVRSPKYVYSWTRPYVTNTELKTTTFPHNPHLYAEEMFQDDHGNYVRRSSYVK